MTTRLHRLVLPLLTAVLLSGCSGGGSTSSPVRAATVATVANKAAGGLDHTLVVKDDASLWSWGGNGSGQLGDTDDPAGRAAPAASPVMTGVVSVAAGDRHSLALKEDGTVWGFGDDTYGQTGTATGIVPGSAVSLPRRVAGIQDVAAVTAGGNHSLALTRDGTVWAWGSNESGELGNTGAPLQAHPSPVAGLSAAISVASGDQHSLALLADGTVRAWGDNSHGQLGNGTIEPGIHRTAPVVVAGLEGIVAISAAGDHSLALKGDGTLWSWGGNSSGEVGDGTIIDRPRATVVLLPAAVTSFAAGGNHSVAVTADGAVRGWGGSDSWKLGAAPAGMGSPIQRTISGVAGVAAVGAGKSHVIALRGDGTVAAWGENLAGQLGNGTRDVVPPPIPEEPPPPPPADAGGSDLIPADGAVLSGTYTNVGRFLVREGVTVHFTGTVRIEARSFDIIGILQGDNNANLVLVSEDSVTLAGGITTGGSIDITVMAPDSIVVGQIEGSDISITTGASGGGSVNNTTGNISYGGVTLTNGSGTVTDYSGTGTLVTMNVGSLGEVTVVTGGVIYVGPVVVDTVTGHPLEGTGSTIITSSLRAARAH
jgi:alpha-tubulin suppressor-like RCC1 family protein